MKEVKEIIETLKDYRDELVQKNYPMGKINELIMKWEQWLEEKKHETTMD